jgi:hypothetical protein
MKKRYSVCGWLGFDGSIKGTLGGLGGQKLGGVKKRGFALLFYKVSALKIKGYIAIMSGDL